METITQRYRDTTADLAYSILLKLGGTVDDIEQIFKDKTDDLLYAILKKLGNGSAYAEEIQDLVTADTIEIADNTFIIALVFESDTAQDIKIGTAPGLSDIADIAADEVEPGVPYEKVINKKYNTPQVWHITSEDPFTLTIIKTGAGATNVTVIGNQPQTIEGLATGNTVDINERTFINALILESGTTQTVKIGTTDGGNEIFEGEVEADVPFEDVINKFFTEDTTLYITADNPFDMTIIK